MMDKWLLFANESFIVVLSMKLPDVARLEWSKIVLITCLGVDSAEIFEGLCASPVDI